MTTNSPIPEGIFLWKEGHLSGPVSKTQLEELKQSGAIRSYLWVWESPVEGWKPATPPPPPPVMPNSLPARPVSAEELEDEDEKMLEEQESLPHDASVPEPVTEPVTPVAGGPYLAVCHNFRTILNGEVRAISDGGCILSNALPASPSPVFKHGTKVVLNLLHEPTGRSESVKATVVGSVRRDGAWEYQIRWSRLPQILAQTSG